MLEYEKVGTEGHRKNLRLDVEMGGGNIVI